MGVLGYSFGVIDWKKEELEDLDSKVRKVMTMNNAFYKHSDVDRLYISREKGGKGMININDNWQRMCLSTLEYILRSKTVQGIAMKYYFMQRKEGTLLQQGENIIDELDIALKITDDNVKIAVHFVGWSPQKSLY